MKKRIPKRVRQLLFMVAICLIPLIGTFLLLFITRFGSGITQDSLAYVSMTRNLRHGEGFVIDTVEGKTEFQTHYPPGVSIILTIIPFLDPKDGFVFLNAVVFFGFLLCIGLLTYRFTKSIPLSLGIQFLALLFPEFLRIFSMMWSEPLFIFLLTAGMLALVVGVQKQLKRSLIIAAILFSYAIITRYVGVSLVPFVLLVLWAGFSLPVKEKLRLSAMLTAIMAAPVAIWYGVSRFIGAAETVRSFGIKQVPLEKLTDGATTIFGWILPMQFVDIISPISVHIFFWGIVGLLFAAFVLYQRQQESLKELLRFWMPFSFAGIYLVVIILAIFFLDNTTPLDYRLLSPIAVMVLVMIMLGMQMLKESKPYIKWGILVYFAVVFLLQAYPTVTKLITDGLPYASAEWRHSTTVAYVRHSIAADAVIYTHAPQALNVLSGKRVRAMPQKYSVSGVLVKEYATNLENLKLNKEEQYLVFFNHEFALKARFATENEILSLLSLQKVFSSDEGSVYRIFPAGE
jgi:hypothetical protein